MNGTLTDRYVWAVTRQLPAAQRDDIGEELRATISDMVEAADLPADDAERAALEELGDPRRLAGSYRDGARHLIGPGVYDDYLSVLRQSLVWVVPIIAALSGVGALLDDAGPGAAVLDALGSALDVTVWLAASITVVFVVMDRRARGALTGSQSWSIDDLPDLPARPPTRLSTSDALFSIAAAALTIGALFVQRTHFPITTQDGENVPLLQPALWDGWMWVLIALLVASIAVVALAVRAGRWTWALAGANAAVNATSLGVVAWLALQERLINPEVLVTVADRAGWDQVPTLDPWIVIVMIGAVEIWDAGEALLAAHRSTTPADAGPQAVGRL